MRKTGVKLSIPNEKELILKKLLTSMAVFFFVLVLMLGTTSMPVHAVENIPYLDENGTQQSVDAT